MVFIANGKGLIHRLEDTKLSDETPFFPSELLPSFLPSIKYPKILASYSDEVTANDQILKTYVEQIVPQISCKTGEQQENLGSVSVCDVNCLQTLSRSVISESL